MFHYGTLILWAPVQKQRRGRDSSSFQRLVRMQVGRKRSTLSRFLAKGMGEETVGKPSTLLQVALETMRRNRDRLGPPRSSKHLMCMVAQCSVGLTQGWFIPNVTIDKGTTEKVERPEINGTPYSKCWRSIEKGNANSPILEWERSPA